MHTRSFALIPVALALLLLPTVPRAQAPALTDAQMEQFLLKARVVRAKPIGIGITDSLRATLTDGTLTHDAQFQSVDVFKLEFTTPNGRELNFRDTWRYNVAAYRVDRMLDLRLVPVSVDRAWNGNKGAFTWWVDDVLMDEGKRMAKGMVAPNFRCWTHYAQALLLFDQLIENTDRNLGNTLITKNWRLWAIDHTRAFRESPKPRSLEGLVSIDPDLLERLSALEFDTLKREIGRYVNDSGIRRLLSRRDALVAHYRGKAAALIPRPDPVAGCATAPF